MLALRYVADADAGVALRDYGLALAASTALALLISVGPDRWMLDRCDAIALPLVAGLAQQLFVAWQIERFVPRLATGLLFTPLAISAGAITIAHANGLSDADSFARPASRHCLANASYTALAKLPPGLVIADVSYGPYLLALTPHSVMGAPYHRLSTGIAVSHNVFSSPPDDAKAIVNAARLVGAGGKPTYLMICGPRPPDGLAEPARGRSLWARLQAGHAPHWLEPIGEKGGVAMWRVKL
jgi:hypothetical protein